ncbi:uncharacterized protein CIMG_03426 [Coccidioides immitis RS]|uniref:Uncharacterized protein n=3 Tax=Coccidioides immitis TaxID=5501 RepID=J3KBB9_COCIM|nr:uncharacterized protein CIMG_03426 [Coccidioides immitis RS]EAS32402.3 hypothetical protein CIMG_03426 [Coccidioides immitis RS]KMP07635.1 hypothetical protein CIRG_07316 [Coccidioides immitis RMSCC 2394]KMU82721.1 hypothetical protein CIHG_00502 [Coccidioides immitis H538.4]
MTSTCHFTTAEPFALSFSLFAAVVSQWRVRMGSAFWRLFRVDSVAAAAAAVPDFFVGSAYSSINPRNKHPISAHTQGRLLSARKIGTDESGPKGRNTPFPKPRPPVKLPMPQPVLHSHLRSRINGDCAMKREIRLGKPDHSGGLFKSCPGPPAAGALHPPIYNHGDPSQTLNITIDVAPILQPDILDLYATLPCRRRRNESRQHQDLSRHHLSKS